MFYFKIRKKAKMSSVSTQFSSVQFSRSVVSDSLWPRELQHARPPCPSPTPRVHSNSHLSSRWCHPAISSSVVPFSSCPQSLPASESFPVSQLFAWGGVITTIHYWTSSPGQCNQIRKINGMHNRKWEDSFYSCVHVWVCAKSLQLCLIPCDPMACSPSGSSVHGILQAGILEWAVMTFCMGSCQPRDQTHIFFVSCIGRQVLDHWATWETPSLFIDDNKVYIENPKYST